MKSFLIGFMVLVLGASAAAFIEISIRDEYARRLQAECVKCGLSNMSFRYCTDRCQTPCPSFDKKKRGSPVVWGHEHLHRICKSCGYAGDAIECVDKEQP